MRKPTSLWVLGHRIRLLDTDESYGLVEITSPPHVPGPPPHFHKSEREFFLVLDGTLSVMTDGAWNDLVAGAFAELSPGSVHTFINSSEQDVVWLTGWRPKGFERFFWDVGLSADELDATERSVAPSVVDEVVRNVERYGMFVVASQPEPTRVQ